MNLNYRDLHIVKHAIQTHMARANPRDGDLEQEGRLLGRVTAEIEALKEKFNGNGCGCS
ncbi:hypothetical protein HO831_00560 [Streptococcus suis]|uniref:Phage protein n=1 Tax=Streptococcus suis TaxID=1307 RepID=A0A0Z8J6G6_STRSU|nr:hypothetical protein [Streptococcus suis]QBX21327.1 hypothetical protein Javan569_0032 [Streptococcus phage Javan569]QBX21649.1 hypothetical protein Javan585_0023 [Streptococcus phage Javan585]MCB2951347.1 hypothetical protein [Streptococcus suis]MCB2957195.1 hypothetical protein [Streptococcus suis]MCB2964888.1 hypothetical protein [Streptococcus suis]